MKTRLFTILVLLVGTAFGLDKFGGLTTKPCPGGATGAWHTQTIGSHFVMCDPLGNAMTDKGVYAIDPAYLTNSVAKYGSNAVWATNAVARLKNWGFNILTPYASDYIQPWSTDASYPVDANGLRSIPNKMPTMFIVRPGFYGMNMTTVATGGTISVGIKDLVNAPSPAFTATGAFLPANGVPDWPDARYMTVLDYMLNTDPRVGQLPSLKSAPYSFYAEWLAGIAVEDSDQTWCFGSGEAFETFPPGKQEWHCSWLTASMSPIQQVHPTKSLMYNADTQVYQKTAWKNYLQTKYGTIGALNTAWSTSSFYTTFGSSASTVSAEAFGTTDGVNYKFTHTLANAGSPMPNSIQILDGGSFIGGDCYHPNKADTCNPGGGTNGGVWGPTISGGNVNYGTKVVSVAYATNPVAWNTLERTSNVCTVKFFSYQPPPTLTAGDKIVLTTNTAGCSAPTPVTVTVVANGGLDISYAQAGTNFGPTVNTFPYGTISKVTVPAAGHVLTVNYQVNGWNSGGTGLMDEDGSHSWMGTDVIALSNANANVAADMRTFLYNTAHTYFAAVRTKVKTAFPNTMYVGPDSLTTWGVPTRKEVFQAAAQSDALDMAILGGASTGDVYTQAMIDFTVQNFGKPGVMATFYLANADSPYSSNLPSYSFATQALRGAAFNSQVSNAVAQTSSFGANPWLGYWWWQYTDSTSETDNWGLVTVKDNAYDGHEAVTATVTCSAPINAFSCGGEAGNYGNVITSVMSANAALDSAINGYNTGISTLSPTSFIYSSTPIGQTASKTFTVSTTVNVTILSQAVTGTSFTLDAANSTCFTGLVLTPNSQCTITVLFAPAAVTSYSGSLSVVLSNTTLSSTISGSGSTSIFFSTLLPSLTNPNTATCNSTSLASYCGFAFPGWSDNRSLSVSVLSNPFNAAPLHISKGRGTASDVHNLTTNPAPIFAHTQFWFTNNGSGTVTRDGVSYPYDGSHLKNGETSNNQAYIQAMLQDLYDRGYDGILGNWKGGPNTCGYPNFTTTCTNSTTVPRNSAYIKAITTMATTFPALRMGLVYDASAFNNSENCDTADANQPSCIQRKIDADLDYATTQYFSSLQYLDDSTGKPIVLFFIDESGYLGQCTSGSPCGLVSGTCNSQTSCWSAIYNGINSHMTNAGHPISMVFENSGGFSHTQSAGSFGWTQPPNVSNAGITVATQENWTGGTYLDNWYTAAQTTFPTLLSFAPVYKGFDSENAGWYYPTGRIIAQQCGQVWINSFAKANGKTNVDFFQVSTWDDYEEGTAVEMGIDNCYSAPTLSLVGNTLTITKHPTDATYSSTSTIQSLKLWATQDGTNWGLLATLPTATSSVDLSTYPQLGIGSYQVRVQQVGMPGIADQLSAAVSNSAPNVIGPGKRKGGKVHGALTQRH
jgi:hypothetical protein